MYYVTVYHYNTSDMQGQSMASLMTNIATSLHLEPSGCVKEVAALHSRICIIVVTAKVHVSLGTIKINY